MQIVNVNCSSKYSIYIGAGIIDKLIGVLNEIKGVSKVLVVTDENVDGIYHERMESLLSGINADKFNYCIKPGETSKSGKVYLDLLEHLAKNEFTRTDLLIAFGGGVVGDLTGFAAATYLRGIDFVQVPTTILAAVDSSVGGKTAINLDAGKNLAGAFHQPKTVLIDTDMFDTLPDDIRRDGFAEVIKYGIISDKKLFEELENKGTEDIEGIIKKSVLTKTKLVEEDEFDNGSRRLLNLGHTFGHAIEIASEYRYSHGEAVATGICIASKAAKAKGHLIEEDYLRIKGLVEKFGFKTDTEFTAKELYEIMLLDKKRAGDKITLVIPFKVGDSRLVDVKVSDVYDYLVSGLK